jgi:hypothetical protein
VGPDRPADPQSGTETADVVGSFTDLLCGVLKKFIAGDRGNTALDVERPETARLAPCGPSWRRSPSRTDSSRSPFAPTQLDGLKIGSDTGTCFKVRV